MRLERVAVGDVIKARIKGRSLWGEVTEVKAGVVYFSPISAAAGSHACGGEAGRAGREERGESEAALIATLPDRHVLRLSGTWMLEIPA